MPELAVVMPVYNEAECIEPVVSEWLEALGSLSIDFQVLLLNDGSTDQTVQRLEAFAQDDRVKVIDKQNEGHGPTILRGYAMAVESAEWVFQVDSDGEMPASAFADLWNARSETDFVFGYRQGREQTAGRRVVSQGARILLRIFGAGRVRDVNVPYRLMRSESLGGMLRFIPADTFAPNVAISGLASNSGARIVNLPVPHNPRTTGATSLTSWRVWKAAARSFFQTVRILAGSKFHR